MRLTLIGMFQVSFQPHTAYWIIEWPNSNLPALEAAPDSCESAISIRRSASGTALNSPPLRSTCCPYRTATKETATSPDISLIRCSLGRLLNSADTDSILEKLEAERSFLIQNGGGFQSGQIKCIVFPLLRQISTATTSGFYRIGATLEQQRSYGPLH